MRRLNLVSAFGCAVVALTLAIAIPARADTVNFMAGLSGASEVPPNQSKGSGEVTATLDTATKEFSWKGQYSGLSGPVTAAHFHGPAAPGKNAGVVMPIQPTASPFSGSTKLSEPQITELMAGNWYVNLHTAANPGGEVRGQLSKK